MAGDRRRWASHERPTAPDCSGHAGDATSDELRPTASPRSRRSSRRSEASYARDPEPVHALLAAECLPLSRTAALRAGSLLRELRAAGAAIDVRDALQAGICLGAGLTLVSDGAT